MRPDDRRRGWRTRYGATASAGILANLLVLILVGSACAGASDELINQAMTASEPVPVFELSTGVCFNSGTLTSDESTGEALGGPDVNDDNVTSIEVVECSEPHRFQVFATVTHEAPAGAPFNDMAVSDDAQNQCDDGFEEAVGRTFENAPELELLPLRPSEASWMAGDRTTYCIAFPGDVSAFPDESLLVNDL